MRIGEKIKMNFHFMGVISKEEVKITNVDNGIITTKSGDDYWKFDSKTGKCLNDNNFGGAYRTITPKTKTA